MCWPSIGCSLLGHVFGITGPRLLGAPLQLGTEVIGMIGAANKQKGYGARGRASPLHFRQPKPSSPQRENGEVTHPRDPAEAGGTEPGSGGSTSYKGTMSAIGAQRKDRIPLASPTARRGHPGPECRPAERWEMWVFSPWLVGCHPVEAADAVHQCFPAVGGR